MINLNRKFKTKNGTAIYLLAIMAILICQLICYGIFSVAPKGDAREVLETALNLIFQASNLAVFLIFIFTQKTKPDIFFKTGLKTDKKNIKFISVFCAAGVIFGLVCLFCFMAVAQAGQNLLLKLNYELVPQYNAGITLKDIFLLFITVLAAPVCEELIFRSALTSGLKKKFNDYATAVLVGIAFALMHMNPEQTVYQFFLGFGSTLLALSSGFILPSIIMHAVSNLIVALNMINTPGFTNFFNWYESFFLSSGFSLAISAALLAIAGLLIFIFGANFLKRYAAQTRHAAKPVTELEKTEEAEDAEEETAKINKRGIGEKESFFIKHRTMLIYSLGLGVSVLMWLLTFVSRLGA